MSPTPACIRFLTILVAMPGITGAALAYEGMPVPPLHVEGRHLKDPCGNEVRLHGWMQPTATYFNGNGRWYQDPSNWTDVRNVAGFLNFMKSAADLMADTTPRYGRDHGWYASFVRMNTDAIGGWTHRDGLVDSTQFNGWIDNFLVPYVNHLKSAGLYLVLSATGPINTPNNGTRNAGFVEQQRLRTFWTAIATAAIENELDNIMFELMNEPVDIESSPGNGDWGNHRDVYFSAFRNWIQPIIDDIRNTGSEHVIWVPTLEWQGTPHQWDLYPFSGTNIGIAAHFYPAYGGVFDNVTALQSLWRRQYKPAADRWPMMITEMFWTPMPNDPRNLVNGQTNGFGNAIRGVMDDQGNVSYIVGFLSDLIEDLNECRPHDCELSLKEGAQAYFDWQPTFVQSAPRCWSGDSEVPRPVVFESNYPNPFSSETLIRFQLLEAATVTVDVYSIDGKKVATLASQAYDTGRHGVRWRPQEEGGHALSSGIYIARIRVSGPSRTYQVSKKIVLTR